MESKPSGLASQAFLKKIDQLRELNVKSIELSQLVVLGDQSSGKSSVLESLTSFSFPQAPGLCTRYATQISCSREPEEFVTVSIIPQQNADAVTETRLRAFKRNATKLTNDVLVQIIQDANKAMGIRTTVDDTDLSLCTFSNNTLKIEICGSEQEHFTVIDVPGIFRVSSPPFTTDEDVDLVRNMVDSYIKNNQTIILAVLPSNVDITTQEMLKMAEKADPDGVRTMGVLTKPDLVTEVATQRAIKDLVLGKDPNSKQSHTVTKTNERFVYTFWKRGHKRHTSPYWNDEGEAVHDLAENDDNYLAQDLLLSYPELHDIVKTDSYECPKPKAFNDDSISDHIEKVYQLNRGPELGTFSGSIHSATFREQSEKWEPLVLAHVSGFIGLVHNYISTLLASICPDDEGGEIASRSSRRQQVLTSYYKVSRKRFVDNICNQVIGHFLLEGDESPLKIFNSELVMGLDRDQLDLIAGEDAETRNRRSMLESEIKNLEAAMKILRI